MPRFSARNVLPCSQDFCVIPLQTLDETSDVMMQVEVWIITNFLALCLSVFQGSISMA